MCVCVCWEGDSEYEVIPNVDLDPKAMSYRKRRSTDNNVKLDKRGRPRTKKLKQTDERRDVCSFLKFKVVLYYTISTTTIHYYYYYYYYYIQG
jgi:hypothetical protein